MAEARTARQDPARNGHHKGGLNGNSGPEKNNGARGKDGGGNAVSGLMRGLAGAISSRIPVADLDERDPDFIRERLPGLWLLASLYFRGEVRGLGNIPESGPVLLVGNHSGGNLTPDTNVFTLAFCAYALAFAEHLPESHFPAWAVALSQLW